jgi:undecaprenyl-diphosphatase
VGIETLKYIFLGIVQGLTEFLPVSSSGHLVILQTLLKIKENIALDTVLHLATVLALVIYFWRDIWGLITLKEKEISLKMIWLLLVGTFFTGIIGLAFKDFFESLFSSVPAVGGFLILTGAVILLGEWIGKGKRKLEDMNIWDVVLIGLAQGAAIAPGLSRSGTTISASLARNLDRQLAARFSFLLAIPAILGAGLVQSKAIVKAGTMGIGFWPLFLGFLAALISGWIAIKIFMNMIQKKSIRIFAYYCFAVGAAVLLLSLGGVL